MKDIEPGLYETIVTEALAKRISTLDGSLQAENRSFRREEVGDRLALHLSRCLLRAIDGIPEAERIPRGVALAQRMIEEIERISTAKEPSGDALANEPRILHAIKRTLPDGSAEKIGEPLTPLLDTTLLTNAPGEPRVGKELAAEIGSADRIDVVMAFVRFSGIRPLLDGIRRHVLAGRTIHF